MIRKPGNLLKTVKLTASEESRAEDAKVFCIEMGGPRFLKGKRGFFSVFGRNMITYYRAVFSERCLEIYEKCFLFEGAERPYFSIRYLNM